MKPAFKLLIVVLILFSSKISNGQNGPFFGQLKAILAAGELNQFTGIKGAVLTTDPDGTKTYACTLKLDGFSISLFEDNGKLELMANSDSYAAVNTNMQFLLNEPVRQMAGLAGYKNINRPDNDLGTVVALMKAGSDLKLLVFKLKNMKGYTLMTTTFKSK